MDNRPESISESGLEPLSGIPAIAVVYATDHTLQFRSVVDS